MDEINFIISFWQNRNLDESVSVSFIPSNRAMYFVEFDGLIDKTLLFGDAHILKFEGEKVRASQGVGEKRSDIQKRKIVYEALDGDLALAEIKEIQY